MIVDLFSKRQAKLRGEVPDVYTYDKIPQPLRVQIVHILHEVLGDRSAYNDGYHHGNNVRTAYQSIVESLCHEYGVLSLTGRDSHNAHYYFQELNDFLLEQSDAEKILDAVELSFRIIDNVTRHWDYRNHPNASKEADAALEELNFRFREHGVGYQFVAGEIIRVDSQHLHAEVVKPALALLSESRYAGAQQEFLSAHEHYRHGRNEEALNECLKAFESVMKIICAKRGWTHNPNATSKDLLKVLFENNLIPPFWNSHFSGLRSTLEAGAPTARNRLGGHGQGTEVREIPSYLVSYVLHLTASAIVFLVEAEKGNP